MNDDRTEHRPEGEDQQVARLVERRDDRDDHDGQDDAADEARIVCVGGEAVHANAGRKWSGVRGKTE
jgi:hypothetical protein